MFIARYWVHSMRVLKLNMLSKFMQYTSSKLASFNWRSVTYYHKNRADNHQFRGPLQFWTPFQSMSPNHLTPFNIFGGYFVSTSVVLL